jgi:3',5'-cyclic AMP phosphodiesterase CpdA
MGRASLACVGCVLLPWLVAVGCGRSAPTLNPVGPTPLSSGPAVLVGAGDIAQCGVPGADATAQLLDQIAGTVFAAGDNVYFTGSRQEYTQCYDAAWGRHKHRTRPIPGNHDYETPGADGYFWYFGGVAAPAAPGFYSYDLGAWHVVALNSNVPIDAASAQLAWLREDLARHRATCTFAYVHHPRFSSGPNGPTERLTPLWDLLYGAGVEVVVSGHDHIYERFAPQDPSGRADPVRGIRQFVAGTGGAPLYPVGAARSNSDVRASVWGVLKFTLREADYSWEFAPVAGESFRDTGSTPCH